MARYFTRLKLALIRNGMRGGPNAPRRIVGTVFGALAALVLGIVGFTLLAAGATEQATAADVAVGVTTLAFVGWSFIPIFGFGLDETLEPDRLAMLPLSRSQLAVGLLVAAAIGVGPAGTLLALSGAFGSFAVDVPSAMLVGLAIVADVLLCLVASRAIVTALTRLLRSRRGRDVSAMVIALAGIGFQVARIAIAQHTNQVAPLLHGTAPWLRWLPSAWPARTFEAARNGDFAVAIAWLLATLAVVAALARWWLHSLERVLTTAESATERRSGVVSPLFPRWLGALPRTRVGAVAAKELRYFVRSPRQRVALIPWIVIPILPIVSTLSNSQSLPPAATLTALLTTLIAGLSSSNLFGWDGGAYWVHVASGNDPGSDLTGKELALVIVALPIIAFAALLLAAFTGGWAYLPLVIVVSIPVMAIELGVGGFVSVHYPIAIPQGSNPFASSGSRGCLVSFVIMAMLMVDAVLLAPLAIAVALAVVFEPAALVVVLPLSYAYGALVWWLGLRASVRWAWWRQPEMLAVLQAP